MWRFNLKWSLYSCLLIIAISLNIRPLVVEQWFRYQLRNEHIVVALSTTPYRVNHIQATIDSLLQQNCKIDAIYLSVPHKFKRDNLEYKIPASLINNSKLTILRTDDYGPATKLLGVLEKTNLTSNTIIITVDDDIKYPKNLVLQLAYKAKLNPSSAIGLSGVHPDTTAQDGLRSNMTPDMSVSILQGFAGIAYRRGFFKADIFNIASAPKECINSDDLFISFYLAKNNITRQVLNNYYLNKYNIDYYDTNTGLNQHALHNLTPTPIDKHAICMDYMQQQHPEVRF